MSHSHDSQSAEKTAVVPRQFFFAFVLVTSLFALWGFANDFTNPLVAAFKDIYLISNFQSSLVQWAFYGGYATMAIPAALVIRKYSYRTGIVWAEDWAQWLGPNRAGVYRESGVIKAIPPKGLPVKWRAAVNHGYSGPAVADGRVYVMDYKIDSGKVENNPGGVNKLTGKERVVCFDAESGDPLWQYAYDQPYSISYAGGPRCTPTVDSGKVYALGAEGRLTCLDAATGELVWEKLLTSSYDTKTPIWGYASHPLVAGDLVYTLAGGEGTVCVALNKQTGEEVWTALTAPEPGYGTPVMITYGGVEQLLIWDPLSISSLNPLTGDIYWSIPLEPSYGMSIMGPRRLGKYLYASGIGNASALIELDDTKPAADIVWRGRAKQSVYCSNSTPFLEDGIIYGCDVETGALMAVDMKDGTRLWQTTKPTDNSPRRSRHATAFIIKHENRFLLFSELGDLILARLSREGYDEIGRFHVLEPTNEAFGRPVVWSCPAFSGKCMFARNDEELVCVDLSSDH